MVLKAAKLRLRTTEVPVRFYKDREGRESHHKRTRLVVAVGRGLAQPQRDAPLRARLLPRHAGPGRCWCVGLALSRGCSPRARSMIGELGLDLH